MKKGQVTIFIIVALVIVAAILIVFLVPGLNVFVSGDVNPSSYLRDCIEPEVKEILEVLVLQGGYSEPTHHVMYKDQKIQYLCYTSESYMPCVVQQPLLINHVEEEIKSFVEPKAKQCISDLEKQYERLGFSVESRPGEINVSIIPGRIVIDFISPMTVTKESTQTFRKFATSINTELYDLLSTATNIVQFESTLGDSETVLYINYYPNLKIDKTRRSDGTTIYELSNVVTEDSFTFASRSLVLPAGYRDG